MAESGATAEIGDGDLPVGLLPQAEFHAIEKQLIVGSRLCVFTDGISESENAQGEEFGLSRVQEHLLSQDPLAETLAAVQQFCGLREAQDDRTLVVLERTA